MRDAQATIARAAGLALALTVLLAPAAGAAVTEQEASQLGKNLTPVGAEKAANKDGTIPEWTGGDDEAPAGLEARQKRVDPFAADKPLFAIDASNVDKYKDRLSEGQIALLKQLKGYRMDVYPTRRSCGFPRLRLRAHEDQRARGEARRQRLGAGEGRRRGGPVPDPARPVPRRCGTTRSATWAKAASSTTRPIFSQQGRRLHAAGAGPVDLGAVPLAEEQGRRGRRRRRDEAAQRRRLAGGARRRADPRRTGSSTRRATPGCTSRASGARAARRRSTTTTRCPATRTCETVDQYPMYAGAMDRYDWKLVGKQELYIPYNNYKLVDKSRKYRDIYLADFVNRDLVRYELHRVWKVEATVKQGMRHQIAEARLLPRRGQLGADGRRQLRRPGQAVARAGVERLPRLRDPRPASARNSCPTT